MTDQELNEKIIMLNSLLDLANETRGLTIDKIVMGTALEQALRMKLTRIFSMENPHEEITFLGHPVIIDYENPKDFRLTFEEWKC